MNLSLFFFSDPFTDPFIDLSCRSRFKRFKNLFFYLDCVVIDIVLFACDYNGAIFLYRFIKAFKEIEAL